MDPKSISILPPTPDFGLAPFDLRFYVGQEHLKIKAVDKITLAGFTVAYLCPVVGGDPIKSELARDFAAMACAAPKLLHELEHLVGLLEPMEQDGTLQVPGLATLNGAREAIKAARREVATPGTLSPAIEAALKG